MPVPKAFGGGGTGTKESGGTKISGAVGCIGMYISWSS